ncbi:hypothetical protein BD779DRAFT_1486536 [Infundibulicybe gibba]|nr:hypothetical protein BD779DRAFT_1486536 [Infundibulicybe gibba]
MIHVEPFNKDTGVEGAMTAGALGQYFRAFLVKLNMVECQLGQMYLGGATVSISGPLPQHSHNSADVSFAIILELKDDQAPTAAQGKVPIQSAWALSRF